MNSNHKKSLLEVDHGHVSGVMRVAPILRTNQVLEAASLITNNTTDFCHPPQAQVKLVLTPNRATVLVACPYQDGIAATFVQTLVSVGGRVLEAEQHVNVELGYLFERIHCDFPQNPSNITAIPLVMERLTARFGLTFQCQAAHRRKRMALFVSKFDHCMQDLLLRQQSGELDCDIPLIVSNHSDLLPVAAQFGIDYQTVSVSATNKQSAELQEHELLVSKDVDLIVLARYMQILSDEFVSRWPQRIINIHHSLLPAFIGGKPYHQAHGRGVKLIGATSHYATAHLDEGPIIEQEVTRCSHKDTVDDLVRKGRDLERVVLARAVRLHVEDRVIVHGNKTVIFH